MKSQEIDGYGGRAPMPTPEGYTSWRQVAGYFDGDGNVGLEVVKRLLKLRIRFVDTWRPQIESIKNFLDGRRISTSSIGRDNKKVWQAAYRLDVSETKSVLTVAKAMVRFCVKKRRDLQIAIDYLEGRITGTEAIESFNSEVRSGRRRGKLREANLPYKRDEGIRVTRLENARHAREAHVVEVDLDTQATIRNDHLRTGLSTARLSEKYGYSQHVIRRILGAP